VRQLVIKVLNVVVSSDWVEMFSTYSCG